MTYFLFFFLLGFYVLTRKGINYLRTLHMILFHYRVVSLPFYLFMTAFIHPVHWFFSTVTCRKKSWISSPIHFGQLFHAFCAVINKYLLFSLIYASCHFCETPHRLYFVKTEPPFIFHLLTCFGILWEPEKQCTELSTKGWAQLPHLHHPILWPSLPMFYKVTVRIDRTAPKKYGKKKSCLARWYFWDQSAT